MKMSKEERQLGLSFCLFIFFLSCFFLVAEIRM